MFLPDDEILLLKTKCTWLTEHRETEQVLTWKLLHHYLDLMLLEDLKRATRGDPAVNTRSYNNYWSGELHQFLQC